MKFLLPLLLSGCAIPGIAPLELQEPKKPPLAFDIGNASILCLTHGMILRWVVVEGDAVTKVGCDDPPSRDPSEKSS